MEHLTDSTELAFPDTMAVHQKPENIQVYIVTRLLNKNSSCSCLVKLKMKLNKEMDCIIWMSP